MATKNGRPPIDGGYSKTVIVRIGEGDAMLMSVLTHNVSTFLRDAIHERLERIKYANSTANSNNTDRV